MTRPSPERLLRETARLAHHLHWSLDAILDHFGFRLVRRESAAANDLALVAEGAALTSTHAEALVDGVRDHLETIAIARRVRELTAKYQPILDEADRLQGLKLKGGER